LVSAAAGEMGRRIGDKVREANIKERNRKKRVKTHRHCFLSKRENGSVSLFKKKEEEYFRVSPKGRKEPPREIQRKKKNQVGQNGRAQAGGEKKETEPTYGGTETAANSNQA